MSSDLEEELSVLVRRFGLDYRVVILNCSGNGRKGWVDRGERVIYICGGDPEEAYRILLHELVEILLAPLLNRYIRLINMLLEYIQNELYLEKERFIDDVINKIFDSD